MSTVPLPRSAKEPRRPLYHRFALRWLVLLIAVCVLAAAAVLEHRFTHGGTEDARQAAAKLAAVPLAFGDWKGTDSEMDEKKLKVAESSGYVSREYTNRKTGAQVSVLLLCGPTGPIGAHTPEVCYAGNGFGMVGEPLKKTIQISDGSTSTYWNVLFDKQNALEPPLRVCWMWGVDGDWTASDNPRGEFALRSVLFKLYVVRPEPRLPPNGSIRSTTDPIHGFLTDFLPEVKKALNP